MSTDIRFATSTPTVAPWSEPLLDAYAPADAAGMPLAVILPPHGMTKDDPALAQLATSVANAGAVAVVATWSQDDDPPDEFEDPAVLEGVARAGHSVAGCAVSYAVAHAAEWGADPARLVLLGELYGGNAASMIALGEPDPLPGCKSTTAWKAAALVAWNADWLAAMPAWDALGDDVVRAVATLSPWPNLGEADPIPVDLVVSNDARDVSKRCGGRDAPWIVARDPTGSMRDRLDEVEAFADGCLDVLDAARATAVEMEAAGLPTNVLLLKNTDARTRTGGGGQVTEFGPSDLELLAGLVATATDRASTTP